VAGHRRAEAAGQRTTTEAELSQTVSHLDQTLSTGCLLPSYVQTDEIFLFIFIKKRQFQFVFSIISSLEYSR